MAEKGGEAIINIEEQTSTKESGEDSAVSGEQRKKVEKKQKMDRKTSFEVAEDHKEDEGNRSQKNDLVSSMYDDDEEEDEEGDEEKFDEDDDEEDAEGDDNEEANSIKTVKQRLLPQPKWQLPSLASDSCSIFRVPHFLRRHNKNCYDPQVISIGPFHYKQRKSKLRQMEEHKRRYLKTILSRSGEGLLDICWNKIKKMERRARDYYSEAIELDSTSFVDMLILDGCFIIELIRKKLDGEQDPIFDLVWLYRQTFSDILLIENQIPFFVLRRLSALLTPTRPFLKMAQRFFFGKKKRTIQHTQFRHLLHLVHSFCTSFIRDRPAVPKHPPTIPAPKHPPTIPCATKLHEGGIKFKKIETAYQLDFLRINFERGVIEIPRVMIWDKSYVRDLNFIAFEQSFLPCKKYVTAYALFMDNLIDTGKDVELLQQRGIIEHGLGNEERVASSFNNMSREAVFFVDHNYLAEVCVGINEYYYGRVWPRLRASLKHDYFKNPWAIIVFLASLFLLLLTVTQTFFTSFPKFASGN